MVTLTITVKAMEGLAATDPQLIVDIVQTEPLEQPVAHQVFANFAGQVVVELPDPDGFPVWQVTVSLSRFDAGSGFLFEPKGEPKKSYNFNAVRLPNKWTPQFTQLAALPATRFSPFSQVVAVSNSVDLKTDPNQNFFDLKAKYDTLAGTAQVLAKTALLNLYSVLTDEVDPIANTPWFRYVRKIVRIDQERFIAEVDAAMFENVQSILEHLNDTFAAQGYFSEPAADLALHTPNIPAAYNPGANLQQMITVKKDYEQGNLQLTLSFLRVNGVAVHLLDCDMDENRNIILHGFDLIKHLVDGGTNPIFIHEYIVEDSAQQSPSRLSTVDLGYTLA
jgi:hypothetical protein